MKLRFTGENPPAEYPEEYPNWSNAYDEETEADQDETTLRPHHQQTFIDEYVSFTAADVTAADGRKFVALIYVIACDPSALDIYHRDWWLYLQTSDLLRE